MWQCVSKWPSFARLSCPTLWIYRSCLIPPSLHPWPPGLFPPLGFVRMLPWARGRDGLRAPFHSLGGGSSSPAVELLPVSLSGCALLHAHQQCTGPPFLHIKRDVFKMGETMACVCGWDVPGKRGREMLGEAGAAVRTDQQPPTTTSPPPPPPSPQRSGLPRWERQQGPGRSVRACAWQGRQPGRGRRGRRSHRDHRSYRQRPGRGLGRPHPRKRAGSRPHEAVAEGSARTTRTWTGGPGWKADPRPQPRQPEAAQKLSTNPWLVARVWAAASRRVRAGRGRAPGSTGTVAAQ